MTVHDGPEQGELEIVIVRSARRRKTVSATWVNWHRLEIRAPAHLSERELRPIVEKLRQSALRQRARLHDYPSDAGLERRARHYNRTLFGGALRWRSIRFVTNQRKRFGSCSPGKGTIRISSRLEGAPAFVLDYVIVHELAHLLEANHSARFWELVNRYPLAERARGYLMALQLEADETEEGQDGED